MKFNNLKIGDTFYDIYYSPLYNNTIKFIKYKVIDVKDDRYTIHNIEDDDIFDIVPFEESDSMCSRTIEGLIQILLRREHHEPDNVIEWLYENYSETYPELFI